MQSIILLDHVTAGYDGRPQIRDVNLCVAPLDFVGIVGPNGGGKTTLARVMLGLIKPMHGVVRYYTPDGRETSHLKMGYLPQYHAIDKAFPISVREAVLSGFNGEKPIWRRYDRRQMAQADELLSRMELGDLSARPIKALSGGELQRVLLARAIVASPEVLVLDEPNTYIDGRSEQMMYEMLRQINSHCAIVMVSHELEQVKKLAKNIVYVHETVSVAR